MFSPDGEHRLWLERWTGDPHGEPIAWIMLNPSTADADRDDPTIRSVIRLSQSNGFGRILVGNLFSRRATDPRTLDPTGAGANCEDAADVLRWIISQATAVIAAWGSAAAMRARAHRAFERRAEQVLDMLRDYDSGLPVYTLGPRTARGHPRHPLYLPTNTDLLRLPPPCGRAARHESPHDEL